MSMLDALFSKGFKGAKCKTLLKLTIPRIKLLRNKREVQLKQMRRDIAKLLETGQEATARIRVEHIIREENIMAAHEIIELFCELIVVRLPIIETQRECPLDLKEAISSLCFAAPRCADLPELQQVQMLFSAKYGKEFVAAATELMPDCGVNRQIIELLSVRAPSAEAKLNLLKEIAEEHELDWDPSASETEFLKPREDLLNGPSNFISGSKLPLPKEKHEESFSSTAIHESHEKSDSDTEFDSLDFPEVPKASIKPTGDTGSAPVPDTSFPTRNDIESVAEMVPPLPASPGSSAHGNRDEVISTGPNSVPNIPSGVAEDKQFIPFISSPSFSGIPTRQSEFAPSLSRTKSEGDVDLQDVLAAAQAAAESAEKAAAAARSAASLAQVRISELITRRNDPVPDQQPALQLETPYEAPKRQLSGFNETDYGDQSSHQPKSELSDLKEPHYGDESSHQPKTELSGLSEPDYEYDSSHQLRKELSGLSEPDYDNESSHQPRRQVSGLSEPDHGDQSSHQPQRLDSLEEDSYFAYPNLFSSQDSNLRSGITPPVCNSRCTHDHEF